MTVFADYSDTITPDFRSGGAPSQGDMATAAKGTLPGFYGAAQTIAGDVGFGLTTNLADNLASNKLIPSAFRAEKGAVNNAVLGAVGLPGLSDFYNANRDGIELASGVGGLVAAEVATRGLLSDASPFLATMRAVPYVRRLATLDEAYQNSMGVVRNVDSALAARGAIGAEQYVGEASVPGFAWNGALKSYLPADVNATRNSAVLQAKALGFASHAAKAAFTEGLSALTLNSNGFLYSDSASQNMMWQAIGLAGAGASGWYQGAYQIRKFVNSDEIKRSFAAAYDPEGLEENRLLWAKKPGNAGPKDSFEGFRGGVFSDKITNLLVGADLNSSAPELGANGTKTSIDAASLGQNRNRLASQDRTQARELAQMITVKGIPSNGYTRFSMDAPGYGNAIDQVMKHDAAGLMGVEQLGGIPDNDTAFGVHAANQNRLQERIKQAEEQLADPTISEVESGKLTDLRRRLENETTLTPSVILDGERVPISEAKSIEQFVEPNVRFTADSPAIFQPKQSKAQGLWEAATPNSPLPPVTIDSNFQHHFPSGKTLDTADHFDMLRLYRAADQAITKIAGDANHVVQVPADANWFQLDAVEETLRRSGSNTKVQWPAGMTRDSAQVESLAQKATALNQQQLKLQAASLRAGVADDPESQLSRLRVRYNLPRQTAYEKGITGITQHPVESLLRGIDQFGPDKVREMGLADVKQAVAETKRIGDMAPVTANDVSSLYGNSFTYMMDSQGRPMKPILAYSRPFIPATWTNDAVAERMANAKLNTLGKLTGGDAAPLTRALTQQVMDSADYELAAQPHMLMDSQVQGSTVGAAPQSFFGSIGKSVATADWIARDNPTLLAASRLRDSVSRVTLSAVREIIGGNMGDVLDRLASPRAAQSSMLMDQFHSFAGGWDLADKPVPKGDFFGFTLADTDKNKTRWRAQFGADMPQGQPLISPKGKEIVLDQLGLEAQQRFNTVTDAKLAEQNTILRANGLPEIQHTSWYVPPQDTRGKFMAFVIGPDGKTVPGMTIIAATPEDFAKQKNALMPVLDAKGLGYDLRTKDALGDFANIWDKAQMDWIHPGTTAAMPGKVSTGALTGQDIRVGAFKEAMKTTRDQFIRHADDVVGTLMKEQVNSAKARANIATEVTANSNNKFAAANSKTKSIYDMYLENLTGKSPLSAQNSVVGKLWNTAESFVDSGLQAATPTASAVWHATNQFFDKAIPWDKSAKAKRTFDGLATALGPYMPFQDAAEMVARQTGSAVPWTSKQMASKLNSLSAAALLRFGEVAHPIMNLAGVINAMPSVIRQLTPMAGEAAEDFATRVGHSATIFNLSDGRNVGILDMAKIGAASFKRAWAESSHPDFDYMIQRGYLKQEVAEFHKQFGAIDSQGAWGKFFNGDNQLKNPTGIAQRLASKGLIGWGSVLSDNSEDFSRSWGHMAGLEVADLLGIKDMAAKHNFAHDIANKMIANYSPANRPEIFQGAVGSTIGLFQSFIQEYYQRMFRYVETGDHKNLAMQYAMQGGLFGIPSVPGWQQFQGLMSWAGGGHDDPASQLRHKTGAAGDLLMGGVVSNIPTLFGAPAADLYSRGDTSVRLPGTVAPPAISLMAKISQGISQGIQEFWQTRGELTHTQLAEVASNMMPNRPIAGIIEQFGAHGNMTDKYGALVSDTQNAMEAAYRVIGLRSERQSSQIQAYYSNKTSMANDAAMQDNLRLATRSAMREGNFDKLPNIFADYVKNGGDPRRFNTWMKENFKAATTTKMAVQLKRAMSDPDGTEEMNRLLDTGVSIDDDANTGDPTERYGAEESQIDDTSDQMTVALPGQTP